MATKVSNHCGVEKDETEFNWRYKVLGIRNPACRDCQHAFNKNYYEGDAKERHLEQVKERAEWPLGRIRIISLIRQPRKLPPFFVPYGWSADFIEGSIWP